ncbi:hypothetical protein B0H14DRAFT_3447012 [Mycena olivaceomarginata]|nr:hypothetical protein B0H14DRAFT_3447012 [Mycena olivaceomarginata]
MARRDVHRRPNSVLDNLFVPFSSSYILFSTVPCIHPAPSLLRAITVWIRAVQRLRLDIHFPAHVAVTLIVLLHPSSVIPICTFPLSHRARADGQRQRRLGDLVPPPARPRTRAGRNYLPTGAAAAGHRGFRKSGWDAAAVAPTCAGGAGDRESGRGWVGAVSISVDGRVEEGGEDAEAPELEDTTADADTPSSSTDYTDTRATGTPVTTTATVPGSPLSSATSVFVSKAAGPALAPAASTSASSPSPNAAPASSPPKKSTAAAAGPQTGKQQLGGLPTSSVVGFSIPAARAGSGAAESVEKNHAALRALFSASTADPAAAAPRSFADASSTSTAPPATSEKAREERLTLRGLVNTGNMCFVNAVLQVLVYCAPFSSLFARLHALLGEAEFDVAGTGAGGFNTNPSGAQDDGGGGGGVLGPVPLVCATGVFMREFIVNASAKKPVNGGAGGKGKGKVSPAGPKAFIPTHVYDALKGKKRFDGMRCGGHQEDAEFLGFFLDTLEELLAVAAGLSPASAPASKRATATPSADGRGRVVVEEREEEEPHGCDEDGQIGRIAHYADIRWPVPLDAAGAWAERLGDCGRLALRDGIHTIADALALISHPQTVQMSRPSRPGIVVDASQQILIDALPPILILHVKRFCYDMVVGGVVEVGKRVAFGPELEVGNDVLVPTARKQPVRYKLFGVVYHHGVSASGGHYMLDVIRPTRFPGSATGTGSEREGWVRIDDELVSDPAARGCVWRAGG